MKLICSLTKEYEMPDKKPKNLKKLKVQSVEKHEEVQDWKHETPAEKKEIHEQEKADKQPEPEVDKV